MPTRLIREGILSSEPVCSLGWAAEVLYRRLLSVADDHGRFHASTKLIRAACYPLQIDKVSDADVGKWLTQVVEAGLVSVYPAQDGKRYLEILKFGQQVRSKSKFPPPQASDNSCSQMPAPVHLDVFEFVSVFEDEKEGARKRAQPFDPSGIELPAWLDRGDWTAWAEDRKARKKPISERAAAMQIAKLDEFRQQGHSPKSVIQHCIAGGYQGLFAPSRTGVAQQPAQPASQEAERSAAYLAEQEAHRHAAASPENRERAREAIAAARSALTRVQ